MKRLRMPPSFLAVGLLAVTGLAGLTLAADAPASAKPNILFLLSDDQCFDTIRATGNREIETPNLDRLATAGTVFTHAYNMGGWSAAVCLPSRMMLNTGRFLWETQPLNKTLNAEREAGRLWAQHLKRAGYTTCFTGKWHLPTDARQVFDVARHIRPGMPNQSPEGYDRPKEGQPDPWNPWNPKFGGFWQGGKHWSEVVGDDAIDFLAMANTNASPFFIYVAFNAPHDPRQSPKEYVDRYPPDRIQVPRSFLPEYPYQDDIGCGKSLRDERLAPFPRTEYAIKVNRGEYYAAITHLDAQIGRILSALETSERAGRTYVFFTSDQGLSVGHHGLMGKQNLFDRSVRVPLIVAGPDIAKGRRIETPVYLQDIMPTTLELAGLPRPEYVRFHSLLPLLRSPVAKPNYDAIYGAYLNLQRAITCDGYKLLLYPEVPKALLFNLRDDPDEMTDLSGQPSSGPVMKRLFARFRELQKETGDDLALDTVFPELQ